VVSPPSRKAAGATPARGAGAIPYLELFLIREPIAAKLTPRHMKQMTAIPDYDQKIAGKGLRMTEQRRSVYDALMKKADHPTAVEVFMRVKKRAPSISLATVYNCLETLVQCGLVRHVHHDRESSRYCANLQEHAHLFCEECGSVTDLPLRPKRRAEDLCEIPGDSVVTSREISFRGLCPGCAPKAPSDPSSPRAFKKPKS
jgi:Fe2+ or Zn2+ uptake regulation protein